MITKLQTLANNPTRSELSAAETWYDEANDLASHLTTLGDLDFDQACCIIAVFSIRQRWEKNVELATRFAKGERNLPVMGAIGRIADNIVTYDDPYSALNGQKTNSFARNISGDLDAVTIDVWMIRAVDLDPKKSLSKGVYNSVSSALIEASQIGVSFEGKIVYLKPAQYQALVWIIIRGASK
jgi:hypothetical protein